MSDQMAMFDGYEVHERSIKLPGLKDSFSVAGLFGPDREVHIGDAFEVTMRFKIRMDAPGSDFDSTSGDMVGNFALKYRAQPYLDGFAVTSYLSRDEVGAVWRTDHGATA